MKIVVVTEGGKPHKITAQDLKDTPGLGDTHKVNDEVLIADGTTAVADPGEGNKAAEAKAQAEELAKNAPEAAIKNSDQTRVPGTSGTNSATDLGQLQKAQQAAEAIAQKDEYIAELQRKIDEMEAAKREQMEAAYNEFVDSNIIPGVEMPTPRSEDHFIARRGSVYTQFTNTTWELLGKNRAGWVKVETVPEEVASIRKGGKKH